MNEVVMKKIIIGLLAFSTVSAFACQDVGRLGYVGIDCSGITSNNEEVKLKVARPMYRGSYDAHSPFSLSHNEKTTAPFYNSIPEDVCFITKQIKETNKVKTIITAQQGISVSGSVSRGNPRQINFEIHTDDLVSGKAFVNYTIGKGREKNEVRNLKLDCSFRY
jgi:hypothetical protein